MRFVDRQSSAGAPYSSAPGVAVGLPLAGALIIGMLTLSGGAWAGEAAAPPSPSRFVFVPYPITEPAIGTGLLGGPVWMRDGPPGEAGPSKPQAFGAGALWTDGGSRGLIAFDHRAWKGGKWRTTALVGQADINLTYSGLSPRDDQSRSFTIHGEGASFSAERHLGSGPDSLSFRIFSATTSIEFDTAVPPELVGQGSEARVTGIGVEWSRDTRDEIFAPATGRLLMIGLTVNPSGLGSSFDAQALSAKWTGYRELPGKGVLGLRAQADMSFGNPPFYLRPYVSMRGVSALRFPGERVASVEAEYRLPVSAKWDLLAFAGIGTAWADVRGVTGRKSVSAGGVGVRFKVQKLFGLTFGLDLARGPDGSVGYVQIGNAWTK